MKKIFAIALVAAMAMNMMSCNEKSNAAMGPMTDSVSIGFAEMLGKAFNAQSRMDSTLDKDAFIKGMKAALNADTAQSYMAGMQMGLQLVGQIQQWQKDGIGFDANTFMTRFVK
ncbi:MAG: hypothetical protein IJ808_08070 [Muribaculaceae bacterium]|nr:hypothetical protein [Muribaculaceae bacterium]